MYKRQKNATSICDSLPSCVGIVPTRLWLVRARPPVKFKRPPSWLGNVPRSPLDSWMIISVTSHLILHFTPYQEFVHGCPVSHPPALVQFPAPPPVAT